MRPHFNILVATLAIGIPIAAVAQTTGGAEQSGQQGLSQQSPPAAGEASAQLKPAKAADIKVGATVYDQKGETVGKVESVEGDAVVVSTGSAKGKIPLSGFGISDKGLVTSATKADIEAAAKKKS